MKKITEIHYSLNKRLSAEEMAQVKGGGVSIVAMPATPAIPAVPEITSAVAAIPSMVADDKRRERPGGGISTL